MTHDQLGQIIRFAHAHGTVLATEGHRTPCGDWWLIVYTNGGYAEDGDGMAFRTLGALRDWLGY